MKRTQADIQANQARMTRRALFLGGTQLAFMGVLGLRMRHLQVDQADEFRPQTKL